MDTNGELLSMAENLFKPSCLKYLKTWLENATKDEIKGLKIIHAIAKHKGQKRFRKQKKSEVFDFQHASEDLRRRTMQSYYSSSYNTSSVEQTASSEILKYKKLSELGYSKVLKDHVLLYVENWILLGDEASYKNLLITCLQGLSSVAKINENMPVTSNQDSFYWFSKEERNRSINLNSTFTTTSPNFFQKERNKSEPTQEKILKPLKSFYEPKFYQDRMIKKMRGSGDFINWVYDKNYSIYQNNYASKINKIPTTVAKPANSSTVIRVLPINTIR